MHNVSVYGMPLLTSPPQSRWLRPASTMCSSSAGMKRASSQGHTLYDPKLRRTAWHEVKLLLSGCCMKIWDLTEATVLRFVPGRLNQSFPSVADGAETMEHSCVTRLEAPGIGIGSTQRRTGGLLAHLRRNASHRDAIDPHSAFQDA